MRILINAASAHMGGAVTYLENVIRHLSAKSKDIDIIVYMPAKTVSTITWPLSSPNVDIRPYPFHNTKGSARLYFDQILINHIAEDEQVDVVFSTTGFGTFFCFRPQLLLVRNIAYFDKIFQKKYKDLDRSLLKNSLRRWHSLISVARADSVIYPSRAIRTAVEQYGATDNTRSTVIPYGFDRATFFVNSSAPYNFREQIQSWSQDGFFILLSVSTYAVHKNFETVIASLAHLKNEGVPIKFVTTTSRDRTSDKNEYDALHEMALDLGVHDMWLEIGYVSYIELSMLYGDADAYIFPSFSESFGHSLVEAMASSLPVIASGTDINREVAGKAGVYFDTFDSESCALVIKDVALDEKLRIRLSRLSRDRAREFSWDKYADRLIEELSGLVG